MIGCIRSGADIEFSKHFLLFFFYSIFFQIEQVKCNLMPADKNIALYFKKLRLSLEQPHFLQISILYQVQFRSTPSISLFVTGKSIEVKMQENIKYVWKMICFHRPVTSNMKGSPLAADNGMA